MKTKYLIIACVLYSIFLNSNLFAQENVQIGKSANKENTYYNGALYDYSEADAINITVMVWGYVKFPGKYIIPSTNNTNQLLSLAGGPTPDANLDEMKLFRIDHNRQIIIPFDYSDLLSGNAGLSRPLRIPTLLPGDIMLVPGAPKWYAKDYLSIILSILSTLASVATLIVYSRR